VRNVAGLDASLPKLITAFVRQGDRRSHPVAGGHLLRYREVASDAVGDGPAKSGTLVPDLAVTLQLR
jgi:hypothetical protein